MAELIQACERIPGQDTCPFHPGHKITSLCKTCGTLVCLECIMSKEHQEHKITKISDCLRQPTHAISRYLTKIDNNLLVANRDLDNVESERKESIQKHTDRIQSIEEQATILKSEIDSTTNGMVAQMRTHLQEVLDSLGKHAQVLKSLRNYLLDERKDFNKVLQDGSAILKFDVGNAVIGKPDKTDVPKHPNISDLQHIKCTNSKELIKKALGALQELQQKGKSPSTPGQPSTEDPKTELASLKSDPTLPTTEAKVAHKYLSFTTESTWGNEDHRYRQISPITNDTAWAGHIDKHNLLYLISSTGQPLREIQTDKGFKGISVYPTTGRLYGGFSDDKTIRAIDTETGKTTVVVQCDINPSKIIVSKENDVLVGAWYDEKLPLHRYKLTGELVHKSPEKYNMYDIDQCTRTKRVVVACGSYGVMILNNNLTKINTFTGLTGVLTVFKKKFICKAAIFDSYGNLIVSDYNQKNFYILDGNLFTLIQKIPIKDLSHPGRFRLHAHRLWIQFQDPRIVMCIEMK